MHGPSATQTPLNGDADPIARLERELAESRAYQTAINEVLAVIARAPGDFQTVLDTIAGTSERLCEADRAQIFILLDGRYHLAAHRNTSPEFLAYLALHPFEPGMSNTTGRAVLECRTIHAPDVLADPTYDLSRPMGSPGGARLSVPLLHDGRAIGVITVGRAEARAFSDRQIDLVTTFADQAVIAVENARLFEAEKTRSAELAESLEYQTATGNVLGVIARAPGELQPVLDTIVATAAKLCRVDKVTIRRREGELFRHVASVGWSAEQRAFLEQTTLAPDRNSLVGRVAASRRTEHVPDVLTDPDIRPDFVKGLEFRSGLAVPLLREGELLGVVHLARNAHGPFNAREIALVETFADQAVIAIENARLLDELQTRQKELSEALNQQTATADVLKAISRSAFDLQPVLDMLVRSAAKLCSADYALIRQRTGETYNITATEGLSPEQVAHYESYSPRPVQGSIFGRAVLNKRTEHVPDVLADPQFERSASRLIGFRAVAVVPMLRDGQVIGVFSLMRVEPRQFASTEIALVEAFADQAVIAIENARLLDELQTRQRELTRSLQHQTAISDVLGVISRSRTELQPVLDKIVETAARLGAADKVALRRWDGTTYPVAASHGFSEQEAEYIREAKPSSSPESIMGRLFAQKRTIHEPDITNANWPGWPNWTLMGVQSGLGVPLLRDGQVVGSLGLWRVKQEPYSPAQIELIETFADQAVIAIENARLLDELQTRQRELEARSAELTEALNQQTATADVLKAISRSTFDLQPVLDTLVRSAARLCSADYALIRQRSGEDYLITATEGLLPEQIAHYAWYSPRPGSGSVFGRAVLNKRSEQLPDVLIDPEFEGPDAARLIGFRAVAVVPLLRDGDVIGVFSLMRVEPRQFAPTEIVLVETFADQAVIAIENARLLDELQTRQRELEARSAELAESLEYQTAISGVLAVMSSSPDKLQPVLDAIIHTAHRLCEADHAHLFLIEGDKIVPATSTLADQDRLTYLRDHPMRLSDGTISALAALERRAINVPDVRSDERFKSFSWTKTGVNRSTLCVPLMKGRQALGVLAVYRQEPRPFSEKHVEQLTTFADQAVIAINNVGLFEQVQARTKELTEALDQQTATTDVLKIISKSPSDLQPVLDAIVATAARLCEAQWAIVWTPHDGKLALAAHSAASEELVAYVKAHPIDFDRGSVVCRAALDGMPVHIADVLADPLFTQNSSQSISGMRTCLGVPLRQDGLLLGVMSLARDHVRPFSQPQIDLVATFAGQAVIAMNNARLFEEVQARTAELTESLEYQTATSEVLGVISRSPNELQPVLQAITETASQLCDSEFAALFNVVGDKCVIAAGNNARTEFIQYLRDNPVPIEPGSAVGRAAYERKTFHVEDVLTLPGYTRSASQKVGGHRTVLTVPLFRDGDAIGVIALMRSRVKAFTEKQIKLVETFADQAVIAMNNARLFNEVQERQKELARSVEELRSLGEVGRTVGASLELRQVLQSVLENACRMASAGGGTVYVFDETTGEFRLEAGYNMSEEHIARVRAQPMRLGDRVVGECAQRREAVQIEDLARVESADAPLLDILARAGVRAILAVPLLHQGEVVGALVIRRSYPGAFAPETVRLLEAFAAQSAIAVNNARLFAEVEEKGEQLRLASQHKSQFLANMSHELRTPLNAILGYTELMQDGIYGALPEKAGGVLGRVQANGQHLLGLINSVLDLSKIEAGQLQLDIVAYGMPAVVEAVVVATESLAIEKKLKLETNVADNLPRGLGDERRITQVLLNLVGNAIKFTEQGAVTINAALAGDRFLVSVADTGPGIPTAELERVFEEFHQVDSSNTKAKGGTGLGLAIAKRIIEMHGGRIWVESTPGQGATFRFELPVSVKQSEGDDEQAHTRH